MFDRGPLCRDRQHTEALVDCRGVNADDVGVEKNATKLWKVRKRACTIGCRREAESGGHTALCGKKL